VQHIVHLHRVGRPAKPRASRHFSAKVTVERVDGGKLQRDLGRCLRAPLRQGGSAPHDFERIDGGKLRRDFTVERIDGGKLRCTGASRGDALVIMSG
jgi:hypothetical protein